MNRLTAAELAAFLGITPAGIRSLIRNHGIRPVGKAGKANLYDVATALDTLGAHDRRFVRKRRQPMAQ